MKSRAVFFDKDGTLIDNVPYNVDPAKITLAPGAKTALQLLRAASFSIFMISNQPGVALGLFNERDLGPVLRKIEELAGMELDGFYACPHAANNGSGCECRKPESGLIMRAASEHGVDLNGSWLVGDILDDIEAGRRAGVRTVLLDIGNETEWRGGEMRVPDFTARSLIESAAIIIQNSQPELKEEVLIDVRA